jgi:hypothetical protein
MSVVCREDGGDLVVRRGFVDVVGEVTMPVFRSRWSQPS